MDVRHIGTIALLAIMAIAALFFFPAAHGSYSSTHGPITALRSFRLRTFLLFVICAAVTLLSGILSILLLVSRVSAEDSSEPHFAFASMSRPLRR
jgi:hypothetical protein